MISNILTKVMTLSALMLTLNGCASQPVPSETTASVSCRDSITKLKDDGRDRLNVSFQLPGRRLAYSVTLDPAQPGMPDKNFKAWTPTAPLWRNSAEGTGVGTWFMGLRRGAVDNVFLRLGLRSWGVAWDGVREYAVMSWNDASGAAAATMLATPIPDSSWTVFIIVLGEGTDDKLELSFENIPSTYWSSMGSTRRRAVANAYGDFPLDNKGRQWQIDQRSCWALCHNLDSQQMSGRAYLFAPEDFSTFDVKDKIVVTPNPGRKLLRLAMSDFFEQPWQEALESRQREIPAVLAHVAKLDLAMPFRPTQAQVATHAWLRSLSGLEAKGYFQLFDKFKSQGLTLNELVEFLRLERGAAGVGGLGETLAKKQLNEY